MPSALPAAGSTESRQIRSVLDAAHRRLGNRLVGAYLFGSATAEGLQKHSDLDILLAVLEPLSPDMRAGLTADLLAISGWHEDERNALLALCRMWATVATGKILSKDAAAEWALEHLPTAHRFVIQRARHEYLGKETQDWLVLCDQVRDAALYLEGRIDEALRR